MELRIDRQALVPVVQQIVDALAGWIRQDAVQPGTRLPSIRQLARDNLLSQSSVSEACERLVAQGILASRHGSSFFVAPPALARYTPGDWPDDASLTQAGLVDDAQWELHLGCGGLPERWRESDDLGYAIRQVTRTDMAGLFNYSTLLGLPALREQLSRRLKQLNINAGADRILTTTGATHGLDLIVRTLLRPGCCVVVESPGYPSLFELLRLHRIDMIELPRTPRGPDVEALQALLASHRPSALFINSACHNPTGSSLAPAVAQQLLQLAKKHALLVVEDDVYADFQGATRTRLAALDTDVLYVGSFSKTLSSSLRVGFVAAGPGVVERLSAVKGITSMGGSRFCESVVASLLANGAYRKLAQRQRQRLGVDMAAVLQVLEDADWTVFGKPAGGLFIWARPPRCDHAGLQRLAKRFGVLLSSRTAFSPSGTESDWLRINVAYARDPRALAFFRASALDRPQVF
ncbi:DNA-binding transcriptional regulator, MocR family, contains an aminotransferase domain [Pseudomonas sp. NFACC09-4]|uniref:aminotransferase-like domain-containing protein n=1 Tax=Pseudomonas sp. NFACC09-4 TaxID=1566237 RepID=UPI0009084DF5|nr:PLP-dependent aminotransferase family protein [Pseudomonas sp. NFACC09-4]SFW60077.1 DNA-binding transcriptional regulator, MocR family, contains an aminotransferase domain [Pseudomonas sp. NFACC09-4]